LHSRTTHGVCQDACFSEAPCDLVDGRSVCSMFRSLCPVGDCLSCHLYHRCSPASLHFCQIHMVKARHIWSSRYSAKNTVRLSYVAQCHVGFVSTLTRQVTYVSHAAMEPRFGCLCFIPTVDVQAAVVLPAVCPSLTCKR